MTEGEIDIRDLWAERERQTMFLLVLGLGMKKIAEKGSRTALDYPHPQLYKRKEGLKGVVDEGIRETRLRDHMSDLI